MRILAAEMRAGITSLTERRKSSKCWDICTTVHVDNESSQSAEKTDIESQQNEKQLKQTTGDDSDVNFQLQVLLRQGDLDKKRH